MTTRGTIPSASAAPGQSQRDRAPREFEAGFFEVDDRTPVEHLRVARILATRVNYYGKTIGTPEDTWEPFFAGATAEALARADGREEPHLALFMAFLRLHEHTRALLNGLTAQHLDFYYNKVLGFEARGHVPDTAHVVVELKKGSAPLRVLPTHVLSAGKDAAGVEQLYRPVRETVVGPWTVDRLHSISRDGAGLHCAPVANSLDGLGEALPPDSPSWPPFGGPSRAALPSGQIGFALASSALRASRGERTFRVTFTLAAAPTQAVDPAALSGDLDAYFTGEKGWLGPFEPELQLNGLTLHAKVTLSATDVAVVDHVPALHGAAYAAGVPALQFLIKAGKGSAYELLRFLVVSAVSIDVAVVGARPSSLESDLGTIDPQKAFQPFGPHPSKGARLLVDAREALSAPLESLRVHIRWRGAHRFDVRYRGYDDEAATKGEFPARFTAHDRAGAVWNASPRTLFAVNEGESVFELEKPASKEPPKPSGGSILARLRSGSARVREKARAEAAVARTVARARQAARDVQARFVTVELEKGLLHDDYRVLKLRYLQSVARGGSGELPIDPQEPYTPTIEAISLSYVAKSGAVDLATPTAEAFGDADEVLFYHVDCFGERQEHGYLRSQAGAPSAGGIPLVPEHDAGELLIGVAGLAAGDAVSLLVEVLEGSADPDLDWPTVTWSVLCDNQWRVLGEDGLVLDTTRALRTSGLVTVVLPRDATADNTVMPEGRAWLRASVGRDGDRVSRLLSVAANAVELRFDDQKNDPARFAVATPPGSISRWKTPIAAVKSVLQPYATFGARPAESAEATRVRAAERLRHKGRALSSWDYERLVLEEFPSIHRVKCIPHARDGEWLVPGNVLIVVVPDLRNTNAPNPLEPRADVGTLDRVREFLRRRVGMQVQVHVKNPTYRRVRLKFKVRFRRGYAFNTYRAVLERALVELLCPWAVDATRDVSFGGALYRSAVLDFVEERPYVDFVTDFQMLFGEDGTTVRDVAEARVACPDAILVSEASHEISDVLT